MSGRELDRPAVAVGDLVRAFGSSLIGAVIDLLDPPGGDVAPRALVRWRGAERSDEIVSTDFLTIVGAQGERA